MKAITNPRGDRHQVNVRFSEDEYAAFQECVTKSGKSQSEYARQQLLAPKQDIRRIIREEIRHGLSRK